jgi:hypothetical protein
MAVCLIDSDCASSAWQHNPTTADTNIVIRKIGFRM